MLKTKKVSKFSFNVIKHLLKYFKNFKLRFILTFILAFISSIATIVITYLVGYTYQFYIVRYRSAADNFIIIFLMMLILSLCSHIFQFIQNALMAKVAEGGAYIIRKDIFRKLQRLPIKYFDVTPSGEIMSKMGNDVENISNLIGQFFGNFIYWTISILGNIIMMFLIHWFLALVTLLTIPLIIFINLMITKKIPSLFVKQQKALTTLNSFCEEIISGVKIISVFKMQDKFVQKFDEANNQLAYDSILAQTASNLMVPLNNFLTNIAFFVIVAIGVSIYIIFPFLHQNFNVFGHQFSIFVLLVVFISIARSFTNSFNSIISGFGHLFLAIASGQRIIDILNTPDEVEDQKAVDLVKIKGNIIAKNLCFGYQPNKIVLKDLNFEVLPKQTIALVGPTGSGKTTLANIITKFYDLTSGQLTIDGQPIELITRRSLRKHITIVMQDTFLFGESIKQNLKYGNLHITDNQIIAVAKELCIHDTIMRLPQGYDTILKDNGSNLSSGERQLLALTRAFLANTPIIVLDEATSSIDTKTELLIQKTMDKLMAHKTCLIIAHRLSTIKNADNILVLNNGQIIESGKHDQLMAKKGFYHKLYTIQFQKGQTI